MFGNDRLIDERNTAFSERNLRAGLDEHLEEIHAAAGVLGTHSWLGVVLPGSIFSAPRPVSSPATSNWLAATL